MFSSSHHVTSLVLSRVFRSPITSLHPCLLAYIRPLIRQLNCVRCSGLCFISIIISHHFIMLPFMTFLLRSPVKFPCLDLMMLWLSSVIEHSVLNFFKYSWCSLCHTECGCSRLSFLTLHDCLRTEWAILLLLFLYFVSQLLISIFQLFDPSFEELDVCSVRVLLQLDHLHHVVERIVHSDLQLCHISSLSGVIKPSDWCVA